MTAEPLRCEPSASIAAAAALMSEHRVSSLLVTEQSRLVGIITDRDLRARILAAGLDGTALVGEVMTSEPITVSTQSLVFDALMTMTEQNVHHLPVVDDEGCARGIVTASDLLRTRRSDPLYVVHGLARVNSADELESVPEAARQLLRHWVSQGARAFEVGRMLTSVSDAVVRRLIRLAEQSLGPAPCTYAWVAFGSQGRREQALGGDQDNALLLSDDYRPEHAAWFEQLAEQVCSGLATAGYRLCPGDIMATNPKWRQPLAAWKQVFRRWIELPTPDATMHASIFFDLRCVVGERGLVDQLVADYLPLAAKNSIFSACLCANVMGHTPPLGFFGRFLLEKSGEHAHTLDLKHRGVIPIVDIARLYALANGVSAVATLERLETLVDSGAITRRDGRALMDAYQFISQLRLEHQAALLADSKTPDNYLDPQQLSPLVREQLRDAFDVVRSAQKALQLKFGHRAG